MVIVFNTFAALNAGFDNGPSGMESEAYLPDSSGKSAKVRQEEEISEGCWWKFTNGIKCKSLIP